MKRLNRHSALLSINKEQLIFYASAIIALLITSVVVAVRSLPALQSQAVRCIGDISSFLLLLQAAASEIRYRRSPRYVKGMSVEDRQHIIEGERSRIRIDEDSARLALYKRDRALSTQMLSMAILGTLSIWGHIGVIGILLGWLSLTSVIQLAWISLPEFEEGDALSHEDFPKLTALAEQCAKANGVAGTIHIALYPGNGAGISQNTNGVGLYLSASLVAMMNASELEQVLNHEFNHLTNESMRDRRITARSSHLSALYEVKWLHLVLHTPIRNALFEFAMEYTLWRQWGNEAQEAKADRVIPQGAQDMANALAKLYLYECFEFDSDVCDRESLFAQSAFPHTYISDEFHRFLTIVDDKQSLWLDRMSKEIQSRSATHPIARERICALGVDHVEITWPDEHDFLCKERKHLMDIADHQAWEINHEQFSEMRKELYEKPKRFLEQWEQTGKPVPEDGGAEIIDAYCKLGRIDDALAFSQRMIDLHKDTPWVVGISLFRAGCILCRRGDKAGIALLYQAIEANPNAIEDGIDCIGDSCCRFGWQKELEEYRDRVAEILQRMEDHNDDCTLSARDTLGPNAMPDDVLSGIIDFIRSRNTRHMAKSMHIVRKTTARSESVYFVVVEDWPDCDRDGFNTLMDDLFGFLDAHPTGWQFCLEYASSDILSIIKGVPGSMVYQDTK